MEKTINGRTYKIDEKEALKNIIRSYLIDLVREDVHGQFILDIMMDWSEGFDDDNRYTKEVWEWIDECELKLLDMLDKRVDALIDYNQQL